MLADYFLAKAKDLAKVKGGVPKAWPQVALKGLGTVPLGRLGARLGATALPAGEPAHHGDDYEWFVQEVTAEMVAALAGLDDAAVASHGGALAKFAELKWPAKDGRDAVAQLRALAVQAGRAGLRMYLFESV